jgi:hypothetical protein
VALFLPVMLIILGVGRLWLKNISEYSRTIADEIIHKYRLNMLSAYLALLIVKQVLANATDTILIYIVYSVVGN